MTEQDVLHIREDFPQLKRLIGNKPPIYLDNACTTLRPRPVIQAIAEHQGSTSSCHGRAYHRFGREATDAYAGAREVVQGFVGASSPGEILFVRNATEGLNLVARSLPLTPDDVVLTTNLEHNSNLLPWQRLARAGRITHRILPVDLNAGFDLEALDRELERGVRLVSLFHLSNFSGIEAPVQAICERAHRHGALVLVDGAQSVMTREIQVDQMGADFFVFSLHKMMGPTGIGVLFARRETLDTLSPFLVGGDTVEDATYEDCVLEKPPERFEAGVANVDGAVGARAAIEYVQGIGVQRIHEHVVGLNRLATEGLKRFDSLRLIGPEDAALRGSVLNFHVDGLDSRGLARVLDDRENIMVRYGKHCAHAWFNQEGVPDSVRVSFAAYNTEEEVETLVRTLSSLLTMIG